MTILIGKVRNRSPLHQLCKKTAEATGFSERTVNHVLLEKRKLDGSSFTSPNKRYKESRERVDVGAFDTDAIRRTVHEFYEKKRVSNTGQAIAGSEGEDVI